MTECKQGKIQFLPFNGKKIEAEFCDKEITSDAGVMLVREVDALIGLTKAASKLLPDERDQTRVTHSMQSLLQQRIYGLALGYEDLNDHKQLRHDPVMQISSENDSALASPSTLCRLENSVAHSHCIGLHKLMVDKFIESFVAPPSELIFDADPTDDKVHGNQENKYYHGYYGHYCFLPLHIYCGKQLLVSYLRPSNIDPAKHVAAIMALLIKYIRKHWPNVKITFRGDGGLCRNRMLQWFERNDINYIVGYSRNSRLENMTRDRMARAAFDYEKTGEKQKLFDQIYYAAHSWKGGDRKLIVKAEYGEQGKNLRFVISNIEGLPQKLYEFYCERGETENRIKELKLDCFSGRTSCHSWYANQFRLIISSLAYILLDSIRRLALSKTHLKNATCNTIRTQLLKVGAVVTRSCRRVHIAMSKHFVRKDIFLHSAKVLSTCK